MNRNVISEPKLEEHCCSILKMTLPTTELKLNRLLSERDER